MIEFNSEVIGSDEAGPARANHRKAWTVEEVEIVVQSFKTGTPISMIAKLHGRRIKSILDVLTGEGWIVLSTGRKYFLREYPKDVEWWKWSDEALSEWMLPEDALERVRGFRKKKSTKEKTAETSVHEGCLVGPPRVAEWKEVTVDKEPEAERREVFKCEAVTIPIRALGYGFVGDKRGFFAVTDAMFTAWTAKAKPKLTENAENEEVVRISFSNTTKIDVTLSSLTEEVISQLKQVKPQTKEKLTMKIEKKTFVNGQDVNSLSDDTLIGYVKSLEQEKKALQGMDTDSKLVKQKLEEIDKSIGELVQLMDLRAK